MGKAALAWLRCVSVLGAKTLRDCHARLSFDRSLQCERLLWLGPDAYPCWGPRPFGIAMRGSVLTAHWHLQDCSRLAPMRIPAGGQDPSGLPCAVHFSPVAKVRKIAIAPCWVTDRALASDRHVSCSHLVCPKSIKLPSETPARFVLSPKPTCPSRRRAKKERRRK